MTVGNRSGSSVTLGREINHLDFEIRGSLDLGSGEAATGCYRKLIPRLHASVGVPSDDWGGRGRDAATR